MHVRQILGSALDQTLGTHLVPYTQGWRIRLSDQPNDPLSRIRDATACTRSPSPPGDRRHPICAESENCIGAAVIDWVSNLTGDGLTKKQSLRDAKDTSNWHVFAAFNFIAGCARSYSALFTRPDERKGTTGEWSMGDTGSADPKAPRLAVAMDNDRCFLPSTADWSGAGANLMTSAWYAEEMQPISTLADEPAGAALLTRVACMGPGGVLRALEQILPADTLAANLHAYLHTAFVRPWQPARPTYHEIDASGAAAANTVLQQLHERLAFFAKLARNHTPCSTRATALGNCCKSMQTL